jgi:predicted RND superfamily exporter protein
LHELEPKWGVIPSDRTEIDELLFTFFSGMTPAAIEKYATVDFQSAPVTFFARDRESANVARLIGRAQDFIEQNPMDNAVFRLGAGTIGAQAAADQAIVRGHVLAHVVGYGVIFLVVLITYRSVVAGIVMLLPLSVAGFVVNAYMAWRGIGFDVYTLPVITLGIGFGIHFGLYLVGRTRESYGSLEGRYGRHQGAERVHTSVLEAMKSSGRALTFTAATLVMASLWWTVGNLRLDAEIGVLLGIWMAVSWAASLTLLPAMLVAFRPRFIQQRMSMAKPAVAPPARARQSRVAARARAASVLQA